MSLLCDRDRHVDPWQPGLEEAIERSMSLVKTHLQCAERMERLLREMFATFTLPRNAEHFARVGGDWPQILEGWKREFEAIQDDQAEAAKGGAA